MDHTVLMAGFGRADITPDKPVHIAGGNWRGRISEGFWTLCMLPALP